MVVEQYIEDKLQEAITLLDFSEYTSPAITELNLFFDTFEEVNTRLGKYSKKEPVLIMFTPYSRNTNQDKFKTVYFEGPVTIYLLYYFKKGWDVAVKKANVFSWIGDLKNQYLEKLDKVANVTVNKNTKELIHYDFGLVMQRQGLIKVDKKVVNYDLCGFELQLDIRINKQTKTCNNEL